MLSRRCNAGMNEDNRYIDVGRLMVRLSLKFLGKIHPGLQIVVIVFVSDERKKVFYNLNLRV